MNSAQPLSFLSRLMLAFSQTVAGWGVCGRMPHQRANRIIDRLRAANQGIRALLARFRAGHKMRRLPALTPRAKAVASGEAVVTKPRATPLPRKMGWLLPIMKHEAAGVGEQLRVVLAQPEMVALMEATPQAARLLRPICRMLGVEASWLKWPADCQPPEPKPRQKRPRGPRKPSFAHRMRDLFYQRDSKMPRPDYRSSLDKLPLRCFTARALRE